MTSSGKILDLGQNRKMNYTVYLGFTLKYYIISSITKQDVPVFLAWKRLVQQYMRENVGFLSEPPHYRQAKGYVSYYSS